MRRLFILSLVVLAAAALSLATVAGKRAVPPEKRCGRAAHSPRDARAERPGSLDELYMVEGPFSIPDNPGNNTNDTMVSVLTIGDDVEISDLNVRIVISHSWVRDLYISLSHVDTVTAEVVLLNLLPQDGADTLDGWFDDEAPVSILDTAATLIGEWRPVETLGDFDGQSAQGDWILRIWDRFRLDSGYVARWGIEVNRTVVLIGTVRGSFPRDPIPNVKVEPLPTTSFTFTNTAGFYGFDNLATGTYSVRFSKRYYDTLTVENVEIVTGELTELSVTMNRTPGTGTLIEEDFESVAPGTLPAGWIQIDVDQGSTTNQYFPGLSVWQVYNDPLFVAHGGSRFAGNHFNDDGIPPNNDWLILPQITGHGAITLEYWAASDLDPFFEDFDVRVSTTDSLPASFTEIVETVTNAPVTWTQHTVDLSDYADSPFYVAFHYTSTDEFMLKIDDILIDYFAAADDPIVATPHDFIFHGNYPNPFNAQTRFSFDLSRPARVQLVLFDLLGRQTAEIANETFTAGSHDIAFDASALSSGIYIARLSAAGAFQSRKIVLLK
ncbi:MAG: choice-of-anchor J domain-containing protein [bacterium]|nr:choice-of-anchor J domain-containing protein [bacterium]